MTLIRSNHVPLIASKNDARRPYRLTASPLCGIAILGIATTTLSSFGCFSQAPAQVPAPGQAIPKQGPISTPATSRTVSVAPDDAEFRTPLFLVSTGGDNGERKGVVALGRPIEGPSKADTMGTIQSTLERELISQALLIAARDELGLPTRDPIIDEFAPPEDKSNANAVPVEIAILFRRNECRALVRRGDGENATILQKYDLGTNPDAGNYSVNLTAVVEKLSRTEFPALLRQLGATGKPNRVRDDAPVPADVEQRLETLSMVEHFVAVRDLHHAIREGGESPTRLAALARAYAQLGMLTEFHWSSAHRVYKARALLYAERLKERSAARTVRAAPLHTGVRPRARRSP